MVKAAALCMALVFPSALADESPAAEIPPAVPVEQRGIAVGEKIPAFEAVDQFGRTQTFESLVGPKGLVLLFVRSADW
jgi:hypothetical protein